MKITRHIVLPEPVEPLPKGASEALGDSLNAAMEKLRADTWAAFGGSSVIPHVRVCGCRGVVHTCNTIT